MSKLSHLFLMVTAVSLLWLPAFPQSPPQGQQLSKIGFTGGKWFDGRTFAPRTVYSVNGRFTLKRPARLDQTLDLTGTWIVPPFAEAHNHNLGTGMEVSENRSIQKYLADGVFYVKIQGNLPVTYETKARLELNRPDSVDVSFAQGSLTASGGQPIVLVESLLARGYYPGYTPETLKDHRYFTIDSEADLERKWPAVLSKNPDFIKTFLWSSDEFSRRKDAPDFDGQKALDPQLLPAIVRKAHASNLRVSTHVTNAADFHNALAAGADEIAHLPFLALTPISREDARLAAQRGIVVITTCAMVRTLPRGIVPEAAAAKILEVQAVNLKLLRESGVSFAIGSDNVSDSSFNETEYLQTLGVFGNLTLLKMWTENTPRTIFPKRKIGGFGEGFEASFLALEGNPIEDWRNVQKIRIRFKQGCMIGSSPARVNQMAR
jgi:hypothetical protein